MAIVNVDIIKSEVVDVSDVIDKTIDGMIDILSEDEVFGFNFDDISRDSREAFVDALAKEFTEQIQFLK